MDRELENKLLFNPNYLPPSDISIMVQELVDASLPLGIKMKMKHLRVMTGSVADERQVKLNGIYIEQVKKTRRLQLLSTFQDNEGKDKSADGQVWPDTVSQRIATFIYAISGNDITNESSESPNMEQKHISQHIKRKHLWRQNTT